MRAVKGKGQANVNLGKPNQGSLIALGEQTSRHLQKKGQQCEKSSSGRGKTKRKRIPSQPGVTDQEPAHKIKGQKGPWSTQEKGSGRKTVLRWGKKQCCSGDELEGKNDPGSKK